MGERIFGGNWNIHRHFFIIVIFGASGGVSIQFTIFQSKITKSGDELVNLK
jgi:hypothetical protein